jgi:N-acetylglutamate synthase-like GNAT family acetyltransferase
LEKVNAIIDAAIATWNLPDRVKRLSTPLLRYQDHDLDHMSLILAEGPLSDVIGIAACESANSDETPRGTDALFLHGIYVAPHLHRSGVGSRLLKAAERTASEQFVDGLLVKAQPSAAGFFLARGFEPVSVEDCARDYPHRFWRPLH